MQAMFNAMQQARTNAGEFDSASDDAESNSSAEPSRTEVGSQRSDGGGSSSSSGKTIGDVFASMMNQNRMAAGVRPVAAQNLNLQPQAKPSVTSAPVGRNDLCPCGSGKKYKKCCGRGLV